MNFKMILNILGHLILIIAAFMLLPLAVALIYAEKAVFSFLASIAVMLVFGLPLIFIKSDNKLFFAKDGLICVALAWIFISLFGALPFVFSGACKSFTDAFFETVSGFTTTGATIFSEVESLPHSLLFWRSFTHWIGGMGVLVFMLAIIPKTDVSLMHILRAEAPGPQIGKLVSKMRLNARILYAIYLGLTLVMIIMLLCGGMPLFDSIVNSFATAGTGGFGILNNSIAGYNSLYCEMVISVFMLLFGINFNLYYLLLLGSFKRVFKSDELRTYLTVIAASTIAIAVNIASTCGGFLTALRQSFFQVSSIITTTGFTTVDFNLWPTFSKIILLLLMFVGSCAGSTGGGLKIARIVIVVKSIKNTVKKMLYPRSVSSVTLDGAPINEDTVKVVGTYLCVYVCVVCVSTLLLALDRFDGITIFSSVMACFNNIGPALGDAGPMGNFGGYSVLSKLVLIFDMLMGRLEIFPMLTLFSFSAWVKR